MSEEVVDTQGVAETHDEWALRKRREAMVVSRFQARAALHQAGLLEQVQQMMDSPAADPVVVLAWQDAAEFRRTSPTIAAMAAMLELTTEQVDDLFRSASQIEA